MPDNKKWERIKEQLHDYAVLLRDRGDRSDALPVMRRAPRKTPGVTGHSSYSLLKASRAEEEWYREKLIEWRRAGRLTSDFTLRVSSEPLTPYTMKRVQKAMPWLETWDVLAVLIELDGVVEENYMDAHKNIREVVEKIADERVERALQSRDSEGSIREIIRDEVGQLFGQLLVGLQRGGAPPKAIEGAATRGQRRCSKCGVLGHTAKTCIARGPLAPDKFACIHCSNLSGASLTDPKTHPVPPGEFHKDDPSFKAEEAGA